ncbi:ABC transporter ATP-binding protein [Blattabacterium cuenoti]|uniref:ABC transporter ATP-binding protein n=1 Tax=Blattabacterium cuenoti TaxID=1653831 RepID=UPI00163B73C0|nr:ABC transporter ATP-binding protein [Blattabacterium cuenoti]
MINKIKENKKYSLKEFINIILYHKTILISIISISIFTSLISAYRPKLIQKAIDSHIINRNFIGFRNLLILSVILLFIESIFQFILLYLSSILSQKVISKIRMLLFEKLIHFKSSFFNKTPLGKIISYSISDVETINVIFNDGILLISGDVLKIVMIIIIMYTIHHKLSIIVLLTIPFIYFITRLFQKTLRKTFREERIYTSQLNSFIQENIVGMFIIQLFHKEKEKYLKFKSINNKLMNAHIKTIFYFSIFFPVVELLSAFTISMVIFYGGIYSINKNEIKPGQIIAFIFFIYLLFRPMRQVADRFNIIQRGITGIERIFSILNDNNEYSEKFICKKNLNIKKIEGHIIFNNVYFSYSKKENMILNGISFEINPGEKVAIIGNTGSGKSTIVQLISRFYNIKKGNIYIDNHSINDFNLNNLRSHIKIVSQNTFLFNDSILNNITLGNPEININMVKNMAKKIGIHDMIKSFPNGYKYIVRERGGILSLGEKQLISILRVQMHPYSILIFDEATTSLNYELDKMIQNAIDFITKKKTSIIITHRVSTLTNVDKIIIINKGNIIEYGTHNELININGGYYSSLYNKKSIIN